MLFALLSMSIIAILILWVLLFIGYYMILKKIGMNPLAAIVPIVAEQRLSTRLFKRRRSFWRPVVIGAILIAAASYLGIKQDMSYLFLCIAALIYGVFMMRLYWKLAKAFGKGVVFRLLLIIMPVPFLIVLGASKAEFTQPEFKPDKERTKGQRIFRHVAFAVISAIEIIVIFCVVGFFCIRTMPPTILVNHMLSSTYDQTKDVTGNGELVTREDVLGEDSPAITNAEASRDYFFPDHSGDKDVVVMTYIVGADLEGRGGLASANIMQMLDATKKGDGLKFVIEAGGSERWFTKGIKNKSYGRYVIEGGQLTKVEDLPGDISMSDSEELYKFIKWAKENYKADRNILVLWDHGGGVTYGYGQDNVNRGGSEIGTIDTSDFVKAISDADVKFDIIGFDACLMQDIEIAKALEPYADYYLASEETEGGYGWFYTTAFGMLAQNPGTSSYDFAKELIGCYDPYNKIINDNEADEMATLSFVDLTLAAPAYDKLAALFDEMSDEIKDDSGAYASVAIAANDAYAFHGDQQIDLIGFLKILDNVDYDDSILSHKEKKAVLNAIQASMLMRNAASAKGINGVAFAFPYKSIGDYTATSNQFKALNLKKQKKAFDEVFSIIAAQKKNEVNTGKADNDFSLTSVLETITGPEDYTAAPWYIEGFENYDSAKTYVDIPLVETPEGYQIQLPKRAWKKIIDCQTMVYQYVDADGGNTPGEGAIRYIGSDYIAGEDENGHPMIDVDGSWAYVDGQIICYEAQPVRDTKEGYVYNGHIRARLNDAEDIILCAEWNPIDDINGEPTEAHFDGYYYADDEEITSTKGLTKLEAGDTLQFMFDYYDLEGNFKSTEPAGSKIRVSNPSRLKIEYLPMEAGTIEFGGVLIDIYQRTMTTEMLEVTYE